MTGGSGNDTLTGGAGNDLLAGDDDADVFFGGADDTVVGGEGGTDSDVLFLDGSTVQSVTYGGGNNEAGTVTFIGGGTLTFSEIEQVRVSGQVDGTTGNDTIGPGFTDSDGDQVDGIDGNNDTINAGGATTWSLAVLATTGFTAARVRTRSAAAPGMTA